MPLNRRMQVSRSKGYENDLIRTNQSYTKAHPLKFQPREISYKVIIKMVFYQCTKGEVDKWTEERTWKQPDPMPCHLIYNQGNCSGKTLIFSSSCAGNSELWPHTIHKSSFWWIVMGLQSVLTDPPGNTDALTFDMH